MPEVQNGFFIGAGARFMLRNIDPSVARYLCLTGNPVSGEDMVKLGLATHLVPAILIEPLKTELRQVKSHQQVD